MNLGKQGKKIVEEAAKGFKDVTLAFLDPERAKVAWDIPAGTPGEIRLAAPRPVSGAQQVNPNVSHRSAELLVEATAAHAVHLDNTIAGLESRIGDLEHNNRYLEVALKKARDALELSEAQTKAVGSFARACLARDCVYGDVEDGGARVYCVRFNDDKIDAMPISDALETIANRFQHLADDSLQRDLARANAAAKQRQRRAKKAKRGKR